MQGRSSAERIFAGANVIFFLFFCAITIYPFINAIAYSLSSADGVRRNIITFLPHGLTLENYGIIFRRADILRASGISLARTVLGTLYAIVITTLAAYALLDRRLPLRRPITIYLIIPMYVYAGLIPYFVLIYDLKLMNNFLVYVLPHGFWAFNMILIRTYMESIPDSLVESAKIDGARELTIMTRIVVPLSLPIIAVICLFLAVWQWNSWFDAMLFVTRPELQPLAIMLRKILLQEVVADASSMMSLTRVDAVRKVSSEGVKMATLIVATLPIIFAYPFFQRYFIKGIMLGAVKE